MLHLLHAHHARNDLPALDIGGGTGRLLALLRGEGFTGVVLDLDQEALARARRRRLVAVRGDFCALPFADESFGLAVSGMLSLNYAGTEERFRIALRECARVLVPGGLAMLEIAAAWRPTRLQGLAEEARFGSERTLQFRYDDVIAESAAGAVLQTELELQGDRGSHRVRAPLFVPSLHALPAMLEQSGLSLITYHAPMDLRERTLTPPEDCLRVWVVAGKEWEVTSSELRVTNGEWRVARPQPRIRKLVTRNSPLVTLMPVAPGLPQRTLTQGDRASSSRSYPWPALSPLTA